jgi:hypothetical protein
MRTIIALLIFITASGCATQKRCHEKWPPIITPIDTVTVVTYQDTIIYKDTTITVTLPADTIRDTVIVEIGMISDPAYIPDSARAETELARATAWLQGDPPQVHLQLEQKQTDLFIRLDSAIQQRDRYRHELIQIKQTYQVPVYKPTRWHAFTGAAFWVLSAIVILYLVLTFLVLRR